MLNSLLIQRTRRVPAPSGPAGDAGALTRQFDAALLSVGFKASRQLLEHLRVIDPDVVLDTVVTVMKAVRALVGDDVEHNVYFKDFPANVPDTVEFWMSLLAKTLVDVQPEIDADGAVPARDSVFVCGLNLLELPGYGTYGHSYEEMLAAHDRFVPAVTDRVSMLHLGGTLDEEATAVYQDLAGSSTPLNEADRALLETLAEHCVEREQPATIPVRENRAVVNRVRLAHGKPPEIDTVTDVLRLACAISGGDVTLAEPTRFASFARRDRKALLKALDAVAKDPAKRADIPPRAEAWKRLGERLHPHEYASRYPYAQDAFAVARGEIEAPSTASRVDAAFAAGDPAGAVRILAAAPGLLLRNVDRAARTLSGSDRAALREAVETAAKHASGRVLLSLREHLANRAEAPGRASGPGKRIFVGRTARAYVADDTRERLDPDLVTELNTLIDDEIKSRMKEIAHLVVDPAVYRVALPLSGKTAAAGYGIMPRGSRTPVTGDRLRFFIHWTQKAETTDFDLSVLLLDQKREHFGHVSFSNLSGGGAAHSGDITTAPKPDGASEFVDIDLPQLRAAYIIPQINVYSGESFTEVEESFFGYLTMDEEQAGKPFEPRAVRMKSEVRGAGQVALPLAFARRGKGWEAVWLGLFAKGAAWGNRVEGNRLSTALLASTILDRRYLTLGYLIDAMSPRLGAFTEWTEEAEFEGPVTFIGVERPQNLPEGSEVYPLDRWNLLVPQ